MELPTGVREVVLGRTVTAAALRQDRDAGGWDRMTSV